MGQFRHVTDLAAFARGLTIRGQLRFTLAGDIRHRHPAAGLPELPEPSREDIGTILPMSSLRGRPVLQWEVVKMAVAAAQAKGLRPEALAGHDGEYLAIELDGAEHCDLDEPFKEAIEDGEAVRQGRWLYVRASGSRRLN